LSFKIIIHFKNTIFYDLRNFFKKPKIKNENLTEKEQF